MSALRLVGSVLMGAGLFWVGTAQGWLLIIGVMVFGIGHVVWHEGVSK